MSQQPKQSNKRYRPYLTKVNIEHILSLAKADTPLSMKSKDLIRVLAPFLSKIEYEAISASYVATPVPSIMDRLTDEPSELTTESIELYRFNAHNLWLSNPDKCTTEELELAYEYRVHHKLLTKDEAKKEADSWNNVDMSEYTTLKKES